MCLYSTVQYCTVITWVMAPMPFLLRVCCKPVLYDAVCYRLVLSRIVIPCCKQVQVPCMHRDCTTAAHHVFLPSTAFSTQRYTLPGQQGLYPILTGLALCKRVPHALSMTAQRKELTIHNGTPVHVLLAGCSDQSHADACMATRFLRGACAGSRKEH